MERGEFWKQKAKQDLNKNLLYKSLFKSNSHTIGRTVNLGGLGKWVSELHYFASHIQPRSRTFHSFWYFTECLQVGILIFLLYCCCGDASSCEVRDLRSLRARPKSRIVQLYIALSLHPAQTWWSKLEISFHEGLHRAGWQTLRHDVWVWADDA